MALYVMPFLMLNLGGEMMYILEQRLCAQNVTEVKMTRGEQTSTTSLFLVSWSHIYTADYASYLNHFSPSRYIKVHFQLGLDARVGKTAGNVHQFVF